MKGYPLLYLLPVALATLLLVGCAANEPIQDKPPHLESAQGIAAVVIESGGDLAHVEIGPVSGSGTRLQVSSVPLGMHVYLFVTEAGIYCMHSFTWHTTKFNADVDHECFEVQPGKISYGGVFTPVAAFKGGPESLADMGQQDDWDAFMALLTQNYPNIAAASFATESTVSKELVASQRPLGPSTGICGFMSADEASALLGVKTGPGQEVSGYLPTCLYPYSDQQSVQLARVKGSTVDAGTLDAFTPHKSKSGWSVPVEISGLGDEARFTTLRHTAQLLVLQKNKVLFYLTVDGSTLPNLQDAMTQTAKTVLSRFLAPPG